MTICSSQPDSKPLVQPLLNSSLFRPDDHSLLAASVEDVTFVFGSPAWRSPKKRSAHFVLIPGSFAGNSKQERSNTMTNNTFKNRIEDLVSREIYLN